MTIEEMEAEIQETNEAVRKRRRRGLGLMLKPLWMLTMLACFIGSPAAAFIAYDCSNSTSLVEAYSLLEPDTCANMGKDGEVKTSVYGEVAQVKQDRMIPVFRCMVVETLVAQYCWMFSAAGVKRYIRFRELRPLEAWECGQARLNGQVFINGKTIAGKVGATISHTMFLSGGLDVKSRCEVGTVTLPDGRVLSGQVAQGLYEITLREEFARLNELTGSLTLTSGVQAAAGGGRRQESGGQSRGHSGVGVRRDGLPPDDRQAVLGHDEGIREPNQHVRGVNGRCGASGQGPGGRLGAGGVISPVRAPGLPDSHQEHCSLHPQRREDAGGSGPLHSQGRGRRPH
jgi:hypothetical protein